MKKLIIRVIGKKFLEDKSYLITTTIEKIK